MAELAQAPKQCCRSLCLSQNFQGSRVVSTPKRVRGQHPSIPFVSQSISLGSVGSLALACWLACVERSQVPARSAACSFARHFFFFHSPGVFCSRPFPPSRPAKAAAAAPDSRWQQQVFLRWQVSRGASLLQLASPVGRIPRSFLAVSPKRGTATRLGSRWVPAACSIVEAETRLCSSSGRARAWLDPALVERCARSVSSRCERRAFAPALPQAESGRHRSAAGCLRAFWK